MVNSMKFEWRKEARASKLLQNHFVILQDEDFDC